jgi:hypothetical protein
MHMAARAAAWAAWAVWTCKTALRRVGDCQKAPQVLEDLRGFFLCAGLASRTKTAIITPDTVRTD